MRIAIESNNSIVILADAYFEQQLLNKWRKGLIKIIGSGGNINLDKEGLTEHLTILFVPKEGAGT